MILQFNKAPLTLPGLILLLVSCTSQVPPPQPQESLIPTVGTVELRRSAGTPEDHLLMDIGILVFDAEADAHDTLKLGEQVYSKIRESENQYLPYVLRNTLIDSDQWGAVRVLPQEDPSVDLSIHGTVLKSDGLSLELHIEATDSSGRNWLSKEYADLAVVDDFPASTRFTTSNRFDAAGFVDPFQDLYDQIANDLILARALLSRQQLVDIQRVSQMRYASDLSAESFSHNLEQNEEGLLTVTGLPAEDDPMLARVEEMRLRHHLFIDTVDEYYQVLYEDMQAAYVIWRRYSFDQIEEETQALQRNYELEDYGRSAGFQSLSQRYDRYRWSKIYEREYQELALGFNREIAPAILELNQQVHGLSGTMDEQYIQWRRILRQLFALESGDE